MHMSKGFGGALIAGSVVALVLAPGCGGAFANASVAWQKEDAYCPAHRAECQRQCAEDERAFQTPDVAACEVLLVERIEPMTGEESDAPGWLATIDHVCAHRRLDHPCAVAAKLRQGIEAMRQKTEAERARKDAAAAVAKELAAKAMAEAKEQEAAAAAVRAEHDRRIAEEAQALSAAVPVCAKDASGCRTRCDREPTYCIAWAARLRDSKPASLKDAKTYLQRACDAGSLLACSFIPEAEQQIQQAAAEIDGMWQTVEAVADDIAQKRWMIQYARQTHTYTTFGNGGVPHTVHTDESSLRQSEAGVLRYAHDKICPVKKAFVGQAGAAQFASRAAAHCRDNPPIGSSQGNYAGSTSGQVALTSQCQTAFATPCP